MDIFEKQQTIEALKTVVKARWFYASAIFVQAVILKLVFYSAPLPNNWQILLILAVIMIFNFIFWLTLRQQPEKVSDLFLKIIKFSQVPLEQAGLAGIIYFSGTANKMLIMMFIVPIMVGAAIYKKKGIIFATISTMIVYSGLVILEYFGLLPYISQEAAVQSPGKLLRGELGLVKYQLIGFNLYILGAAFYAGYLSNLFKRREKRLVLQKNELSEKTQILTVKTQELSKTKDYLHEALTKSDAARIEIGKTKTELEKANFELQAKLRELEKYGQVTIGRELKMAELKKEIKKLQDTVGDMQEQLNKK